jgi:hypothetical protein
MYGFVAQSTAAIADIKKPATTISLARLAGA